MPEKYTFPQEKNLENERSLEIKNELIHSLDVIRQADLFNDDFLDKSVLVIFGKEKDHKFENGEIMEVPKGQFNKMDFMRGRRIDFVGVSSKNEFEEFMEQALKEKHALGLMFLDSPLTYEEFVAHEMAHNLFDKQYVQGIGGYEQTDGITDVPDDYREKIKEIVIPLVKEYCPNAVVEKFTFSRQQIAEIFALLHEREFCRRSTNLEVHNAMEKKLAEFFEDPSKMLNEFNEKNNSNYKMDDLYKEKHYLATIVAPLMEKKYPGWEERMDIFWK